jgi:hypothetical protein
MKIIAILSVFLIFPVLLVYSHGVAFFEFNPDISDSLNVISLSQPAEIFLPQNEFIGGVDFWVDNSGNSGTAIFELRNENNVLIRSKTITIPNIPVIFGGQRMHVDFNSQTAVTSNKNYYINIISSMPDLNIYSVDRIQIIGHNAPYVSEFINGIASLAGVKQDFSFKFALYENTEFSPPSILNLITSYVSPTQTRLDFNSNEPVDYSVDYGPTGGAYNQKVDFNGQFEYCGSGIVFCTINIPTVPNLSYDFQLTVKDVWSNESQSTGSFISSSGEQTPTPSTSPESTVSPSTTPLEPTEDTIPPVISNVFISSVTHNSIEVAWTTNEATNSQLLISTPALISIAANSDSTFELEHLVAINGELAPDKIYLATVTSADFSNNSSLATMSFTTLKAPVPTPTPSGSTIPTSFPSPPTTTQPPSDNGGGGSQNDGGVIVTPKEEGSVYVEINSDLSIQTGGTYRIDIFDENKNLIRSINVGEGINFSEATGIADGRYTVIVYENEGDVFRKVDKPVDVYIGDSLYDRMKAYLPYMIGGLLLLAGVAWKMNIFGKKNNVSGGNNSQITQS